jgi:glycine/D-amino acid oxidase-like deaminating enzyme
MSIKETYDYVIIGAGIAGLSAAYHLGKDGHSALVLEATDGKDGASQASTAEMNHDPDASWDKVVERHGLAGAKKVWQLSDLAIDVLTKFAHRPGEEHFGTNRLPAHLYSYHEHDAEELKNKYEFYKSIGADVTFAEDGSALHESYKAVLTIVDEGETNNQEILKLLAHAVREQGGEIHHQTRVMRITSRGGVPAVETENGETYLGRRIIIATGDGKGLTPVPLVINRVRTFVIAYERKDMRPLFRESLMWDTDEPFHYTRSFDNTRLWVGGEDVEEKAHDPKGDAGRYAAIENYAKDVLHLDDSYKRDGEWNAVFFPSERGLPYIGDFKDTPLSVSVGFGGSGILTSFISGYLHAAWLRGEHLEYKTLFAPE